MERTVPSPPAVVSGFERSRPGGRHGMGSLYARCSHYWSGRRMHWHCTPRAAWREREREADLWVPPNSNSTMAQSRNGCARRQASLASPVFTRP